MSEADLAAQLIERLLAEPDFRVRFRRDPAAACREAGLEQLAQEMSLSAGKAMVTLDVRESRSSLAGVMMAAAMEGVGLYHFSEDVLPHLADVPSEIGDVLSRVNLPAIKGALASSPERSEPVALAEPPEAPPAREAAPVPPEVEDEPKPKPRKEPKPAALDPGQFGAEGAGGQASPEALALLDNENVVLDSTGIADLKAGRIDPRIVAILTKLSGEHKITVSCMCSDHSKFTAGGSISNHHYGRGLDIAAVDGVPVNASNFDAREIATALQDFDPAIRPDEIGTPWAISGNGYFTDSGHQDHLHIGFKQQITPDWQPEGAAAPAPSGYPGDDASKQEIAAWMAAEARKRGLPGELPVMASLVESGLKNLNFGHADSVGFFQMRVGIWNKGAYAGYPEDPRKQIDWFLDTAEAQKRLRLARGQPVDDPSQYGEWIADIERPAEQFRYRYQLKLDEARGLLGGGSAPAVEPEVPVAPAEFDPGQFGAEGAGGQASPEALALLDNENVVLDSTGIADLKAGRIDPRIVAILTKLSGEHKITVSCMCSDHSKFTAGGSISNHHYGRGLDIAAVDGVPVNASNFDAREIATALQDFDPAIRPDEIGTPWAISGNGYFTDSGHQDHLHIGFKQQITPDWKPPGGLAASVAAPRRPGDSMVFATVGEPPGEPTANTLSFAAVPREVAEQAPAPAPAAADGAGSKAQAAVAEAKKHLGTPYQWGGSTPETNFDCSGLVQWSYAQAGIQIPRVTYDQIAAENGTEVGRDALLPGDLVFFADAGGDVHHVGMSLGGDKFIHAPSTGDVVKISSLDESYYAEQFTGGRRFDAAGAGPTAEPTDVAKAQAAVARDAADVRREDSLLFAAVKAQEAAKARATVQFVQAVPSKADAAPPELMARAGGYPGDNAPKPALAKWLAGEAQRAGLPPELPVMAALVESGVKNLNYGDADSVGFFQMRVGIWNQGAYAGYPERPELQAKWFIDTALAVKKKRIAAGDVDFGKDPSKWGEWIADVELPAEQYRSRYQLRLDEARGLLG